MFYYCQYLIIQSFISLDLFNNLPILPVLLQHKLKLRYLHCLRITRYGGLCDLIYHKSDFIPFFLLITQHRKEKALSRACHHWWCFALLIGLFVFCIFSQEEKNYSSSSPKSNLPVIHGNCDNSSISSFKFGFILFTA